MAEKILIIDLGKQTCETQEYDVAQNHRYGRGLALDLIKEYVPAGTERWDSDNAIVLVPGLFAGNRAPSAGRMFVATIIDAEHGIQYSNTSGNIPQRLGSLGIAAVLIKGAADHSVVIHIDDQGNVSFDSADDIPGTYTQDIIHHLKSKYGKDLAAIGSGLAGDMGMPLSTFWCTYCDGEPEYHTPRSGFGDVWGFKHLRAVVVDVGSYFDRECNEPDKFMELTRELTQIIINDDICGGALPSLGSVTLMKALKNRQVLDDFKAADRKACGECKGINRACAPMCVIGCLNRHDSVDSEHYMTPAHIESQAWIKKVFGVDDYQLAGKVIDRTTELCLASTEFITASKFYAAAIGEANGTDHMLEWLDEIEKGSLIGKVIASRTTGMQNVFTDPELKELVDRKTTSEEKNYDIKMQTKFAALGDISPLELLYAQVYALENLGFCIFTAFALLDEERPFQILAEMMSARTGTNISAEELLLDARKCMHDELEFESKRWAAMQTADIPTFTKVLYRYFGDKI